MVTTIDANLQAAAAQALGDQPGAVVAVDPRTGDVLALYANPSYDPNTLSNGTDQSIVDAWNAINADPGKPLVSRAKDELFLPGSTGKLITASAALENGYGPESEWDNPQFLDLPQSSNTLANFGNSLCNGGSAQVTMAEAFKESCNVTFAEIGLKLGARNMSDQARAYGFCPTDPPDQIDCIEPTIPFVLPFQNGHFPVPAVLPGQQAVAGVQLDRLGQRAHEPAAHGPDLGGDRERRQDDEPPPDQRDPRRERAGGAHVRQRAVRDPHRTPVRRGGLRAMMLSVTQSGRRLGVLGIPDPGGGQDRHGHQR